MFRLAFLVVGKAGAMPVPLTKFNVTINPRRNFSMTAINRLRDLALKRNSKAIISELQHIGLQPLYKSKSILYTAAKYCVFNRDYSLVYEILECLQDGEDSGSLGTFKIGLLYMITTCLEAGDLHEATLAYMRLTNIGGKLDFATTEKLVQELAAICDMEGLVSVVEREHMSGSLLTKLAYPLILSGNAFVFSKALSSYLLNMKIIVSSPSSYHVLCQLIRAIIKSRSDRGQCNTFLTESELMGIASIISSLNQWLTSNEDFSRLSDVTEGVRFEKLDCAMAFKLLCDICADDLEDTKLRSSELDAIKDFAFSSSLPMHIFRSMRFPPDLEHFEFPFFVEDRQFDSEYGDNLVIDDLTAVLALSQPNQFLLYDQDFFSSQERRNANMVDSADDSPNGFNGIDSIVDGGIVTFFFGTNQVVDDDDDLDSDDFENEDESDDDDSYDDDDEEDGDDDDAFDDGISIDGDGDDGVDDELDSIDDDGDDEELSAATGPLAEHQQAKGDNSFYTSQRSFHDKVLGDMISFGYTEDPEKQQRIARTSPLNTVILSLGATRQHKQSEQEVEVPSVSTANRRGRMEKVMREAALHSHDLSSYYKKYHPSLDIRVDLTKVRNEVSTHPTYRRIFDIVDEFFRHDDEHL